MFDCVEAVQKTLSIQDPPKIVGYVRDTNHTFVNVYTMRLWYIVIYIFFILNNTI